MRISRYPILSALILILATLASLPAASGEAGLSIYSDREILFQVSTIDALLLAVYDGVFSVGELKEKGDFGIGTFDKLAGEMILLDGVCYQVKEDGVAYAVSDDMTTPFASVTFFDHDETVLIEEAANLTELVGILEASLPSKNAFYAIRIDGTFPYVRTRSVPGQERPYPLLVDVTARQTVFEFENATVTIVGFYTPQFAAGINVPGSHLHFITFDRTAGGHILDLRVDGVEVALDVTTNVFVALPAEGDFFDLDLTGDLSADLEKV
ncbi:acetolactate decarboxylase [Candidatus Methanocrinis natronophilus]|uniref:Alpha-acetolactate decarboxylase n=1 Tax=Candidatus Methanocrinis natronophilus TaxID=3033396 RepID=A0ABT5X8K5_9EURY|nr:acetolactate decarboxylase [Candidatus Methanocrinis natronophilus]MDF0591018.1 acetolactate decarboxylase [Candidatus Methanocrinis natronophilus]